MLHKDFNAEQDGFHGSWYPSGKKNDCGLIVMLGDSADDLLAKSGAKWLIDQGFEVMAMAPARKDYGHHNYPLERFAKAIAYMKEQGCRKIGIVGASTTGMLSLIAASYYPEITLTIALSPSDFVMEGFYRDNKDGMAERPGDGESTVSFEGKPLPYLPFAYRHPEYWQKIEEESKKTGNKVASRELFDESERSHPLKEEEKIKVEKIKGRIIFIGAEDDVLWDTCRYIRRMEDRLSKLPHECSYESLLYEHGTHFVFPQSLLKKLLPFGSSLLVSMMFKAGKEYPEECRNTRIDIDRKLRRILQEWREA